MTQSPQFTESVQKRFQRIWSISERDDTYCRMFAKLKGQGDVYQKVLAALTPEQQDVIRGYLDQCEVLHWRMLQVACEQMRFLDSEDE